jgi:hypothetical protein
VKSSAFVLMNSSIPNSLSTFKGNLGG